MSLNSIDSIYYNNIDLPRIDTIMFYLKLWFLPKRKENKKYNILIGQKKA